MGNKGLGDARRNPKDEFYTSLTDIEKEMIFHKDSFKDKVVFCNCDDPEYSNFWKYFYMNFSHLGLKKLIATHYDYENPTYKLEYDGKDIIKTKLEQNGDFRSDEAIQILKESDICVTNPPFSLFREFLQLLVEYNKEFLILGNINAMTYKEVFPLIREEKIWLGASIKSGDREFRVPDDYPLRAAGCRVDEKGNKYVRVKGVRWFTNLDYDARHEDIILYKEYSEDEYPKYSNYNAINIGRTKEIPMDYFGEMGVPITFIDKYNPEQFKIIGNSGELAGEIMIDNKLRKKPGRFYMREEDGQLKRLYDRIVIKRK